MTPIQLNRGSKSTRWYKFETLPETNWIRVVGTLTKQAPTVIVNISNSAHRWRHFWRTDSRKDRIVSALSRSDFEGEKSSIEKADLASAA